MKRKFEANDDKEEDISNIKVFENCVYFYAEISRENILTLREKLDEATKNANENQFKKKCIYLYINSGGGCAYAGISGLNMIKKYPCKIITIADGFVASAATLLYLAGTKRYITQFSQVLIHQVSTAFYGKYTELKDEVKNSTDLMQSFRTFYKNTTILTPELIDQYLSKELCFTSRECKKYGLAHKII